MKAIRVVIGVFVFVVATGATIWWRGSPVSRPPVADFQEKLDLGPQKFGAIVTGMIRVANSGGSPLELSHFRTSCSCAGVEVLEKGRWRAIEKARLGPMDRVDLAVRISVGALPGMNQRVYVQFTTNDPNRPNALVEVLIPYVIGEAHTDPAAVIFGSLSAGEPARRTVTIYDCGVSNRQITRVTSKHPDRIDARLLPPGKPLPKIDHPYAGQPIGQVEVIALTDKPGPIICELEVELVDTQTSFQRIPVTGEVIGPIETTPTVLFLPKVVSGQVTHTATVQLCSRSGEPITPSVEYTPDGLTASITQQDRASAILVVACRNESLDASTSLRRSNIKVRVQTPSAITTVDVPVSYP